MASSDDRAAGSSPPPPPPDYAAADEEVSRAAAAAAAGEALAPATSADANAFAPLLRWWLPASASGLDNIGGDGEEYAFDVVCRGTLDGHRMVVLCEVKTNITIAEVESFISIAMRAKPHIDTADVRTLFFGYRAGQKAQQLMADHRSMLAFPRGLIVS